MKKLFSLIIVLLSLNTALSQTWNKRTIYTDTIWRFVYPNYLSIKEAIDSSVFIFSEYTEYKGRFVFNEDSMTVKTYHIDSLVEVSPIVKIEYSDGTIAYNTRITLPNNPLPPVGPLIDGKFVIMSDDKNNPIMLFGGYSEELVETAFFCKIVKSE